MVKKLSLSSVFFFLCACTTDPIPEEEFEGPTANFPLLGHVPDRPPLPEPASFTNHQKRLQSERDKATKEEADIIKLTKP